MNNTLLKLGAIGVCIYLISTGLAYAAFSNFGPASKQLPTIAAPTPAGPQARFTLDPSIPRTEPCPINGKLYTEQEREVWEKRRPLAVMIENSTDSRPQSGLSRADVVYEAIAEGGITRFMGVFYCGASVGALSLAPVRSARIYYLPWVLEYDALYNHVGGAGNCDDPTVDERAKALCRIEQWKVKDMDQFGISFPTCYRNYDRLPNPVATEHTMVCDTDKLFTLAEKRGWTNVDSKGVPWDKNFTEWTFKDDTDPSERASTVVGTIEYSSSDSKSDSYGVKWVYDAETNAYKRYTGGEQHMDLETEEQLSPRVVALLFAKFTGSVDEHFHNLYENTGTGKAVIFQDGTAIEGTWKKANNSARTVFFDEQGKELALNRGQVWIDMLPTGTTVTY